MIKYTTTEVTFREIPDEISLCINISNCPHHCPDCHSKELWEDIGTPLTIDIVKQLLNNNPGITCLCLMGEGNEWSKDWDDFITSVKQCLSDFNSDIKFAIYSGCDSIGIMHHAYGEILKIFDYIKVGPYIKERGSIDKITTNQRLYKTLTSYKPGSYQSVCNDSNQRKDSHFLAEDITYKFWQHDNNIA